MFDNLDYRKIVIPLLESLAEETGIAVFFNLVVEDRIFVVAGKEGREKWHPTYADEQGQDVNVVISMVLGRPRRGRVLRQRFVDLPPPERE